jgi:lysophospholipase L1-like esterase
MQYVLGNMLATKVQNSLNPLNVPGLVAGYNVNNTIRTGSSIDQWTDISGNGRHATPDGAKDTVFGTTGNEYASGTFRYSPAISIPATLTTGMSMICIFGAGRVTARNSNNGTFAFTNPASNGGGVLFGSSTAQFFNLNRFAGCLRNQSGINSVSLLFNSSQSSIISNGIKNTTTGNASVVTSDFIDIWGYDGAGAHVWLPERVALYFYNRVLSDSEISGIEKWHNVKKPKSALHVVGDSFVQGTGASTAPLSYARLLEANTMLDGVISGVLGQRASLFAGNSFIVAVNSSVLAGLSPKVVLDMGKNDLAANISSATLQSAYTTLCNQIKATGARLICVSMPPRKSGFSGGTTSESYETERLSFNTWMRSQAGTLFDALADTGGDTDIGPASSIPGVYWSADSFHLSDAGHAKWASIIEAVI